MMFVLGQRLAEIKRLITTLGPHAARNRSDVQELLRQIEQQIILAEEQIEAEVEGAA